MKHHIDPSGRPDTRTSDGWLTPAAATIAGIAVILTGIALFSLPHTSHPEAGTQLSSYISMPLSDNHPSGNIAPSDGVTGVVYLFDSGECRIPESADLTALADNARRTGRSVRVVAYTDPSGSRAYNRNLSRRRAEAVAEYLVAHGVERDHITATGLGETASYPTLAQSRRAEATLN